MKNRRKIKKVLKYTILLPFLLCVSIIFAFFTSFFIITHKETLSQNNLTRAYNSSITVTDIDNKLISNSSQLIPQKINIENLPIHTINAFISTEDKSFYSHSGINPKRMVGALVANIKNGKIVQGASTISQQLIKNTHLTNEKSLERKLKEIKLTLELEKKYSKQQILEMYLSNIYFGQGYYGLNQACHGYFNKAPTDLSLPESAMLAGIISAPSTYNPITNIEKAVKRKNLVLSEMLKDKKISKSEYDLAKNITPSIHSNNNSLNQYINACLHEASEILHLNHNQLLNRNYKIKTYLNNSLQTQLEKIISNNTCNLQNTQAASMITNNKGEIIAFAGNTNKDLYTTKRQPGSAIKPIIVYTPALEYNKITPATIIIDEPINFEGYSPENASKSYSGKVTTRQAITKSLNIPAVKILNAVGVEKAKQIASLMGITFDKLDQNLSLALGGFTNGVTMQELSESYLVLQNGGNHISPKFISEIRDENNNIVYKRAYNTRRVIKEDTAALITNMLEDVAKYGTASRLDNLHFPVAAKTGTVGVHGSNKNTDAWNVSYTTDYVITTWLGANDNNDPMPTTINGSSYPTNISKNILAYLYHNTKPSNFELPKSVIKINIDSELQSKGIIVENNNTNSVSEIFSQNNKPEILKKPEKPQLFIYNFANKKPELQFFANSGFSYNIYKNNKPIASFAGNDDTIYYNDIHAIKGEINSYFITCNYKDFSQTSETVKVLCQI